MTELLSFKGIILLNSLTTRDENAEFANSVDLDKVAPHLDLHCLPSNLWILNML